MDCLFCHCELEFLSRRHKVRSSEIEESQYQCPKCHHTLVIRDGLQHWYDENNKPVHGSHDR